MKEKTWFRIRALQRVVLHNPSVRKKRGHRNASGVIDETAQYANNLKSNQTQPSTELYLEIFSACASSHSWEETHFRVESSS